MDICWSLTDVQQEHIPTHLYIVYHWVIPEPKTTLSSETRLTAVNCNAMSLAQTTLSTFLSKHQVSRKKTQSLREMPQKLAVGLAIHQAIKSRKVVNILQGLGMSAVYNRPLWIEPQITNTVLRVMLQDDSAYLPPDVIKGRLSSLLLTTLTLQRTHRMGTALSMLLQWPSTRDVNQEMRQESWSY